VLQDVCEAITDATVAAPETLLQLKTENLVAF
jgi:hypothetical protein